MTSRATSRRLRLRARPWFAWLLTAVTLGLASGGAALGVAMAPTQRAPNYDLSGAIRAPGGPFLVDKYGRAVLLHGVNVVYKRPPFEVYPDPGAPWNFGPSDVRRMRRLGVDVVRLGIIWQGLEPGTLPPNDPRVCAPGRPRNPHQLNKEVLFRYLDRLRKTVDLLGRAHIYTLLDMHQDVYGTVLGGEGPPRWAVCTDGVKPTRPPGRWSRVYGTLAADIAFRHFWTNNVVGDLQGQFDRVWGMVARFFRNDSWVIGFDPYNEPFSLSLVKQGGEHFDAELECFYAGSAHVGRPLHGAPRISCPPDDPRTGVIPTLLRNAPHKLVFEEPDIFARRGGPTYLGPLDFPNLVYNLHIYCSDRTPTTGNPLDESKCIGQDARSLGRRMEDRREMASRAQPRGPAWFVTEFGATSSTVFLRNALALMNQRLVGWTYWAWKYYGDPTGSADEALVTDTGAFRPSARAVAQPYAEAIAGTPTTMQFDPFTTTFVLRYRVAAVSGRRAGHGPIGRHHRNRGQGVHLVRSAPTLIEVPTALRYPLGYCVTVTGGRIVSAVDRQILEIRDAPGARTVDVTVTAAHSSKTTGSVPVPLCGRRP